MMNILPTLILGVFVVLVLVREGSKRADRTADLLDEFDHGRLTGECYTMEREER